MAYTYSHRVGRRGNWAVLSALGVFTALGAAACDAGNGHGHADGGAIGTGGAGDGGSSGAGGMSGSSGAAGAGMSGGGGACGVPDGGVACSVPGCGPGGALPGGVDMTDVWIGPAGEVWAVGQAGFVGHRAPGTGAWCWCAPNPPATLNGVWGASSDNVFAVGDDGALLRFDGAHWLIYFGPRVTLRAVFGTAVDNVWAVGDRGTAIRFDGTHWEQTDTVDARHQLNAVWIDPTGVVRAAGSAPLTEGEPGASSTGEAIVVRRAPATASWIVEASFPQRGSVSFQGLSGSSATNAWAVGTNTPSGAAARFGFIVHFDGTAWVPTPSPPGQDDILESRFFTDVTAATPDGGAAWFTGGTSGLRFDGTSWTVSSALTGAAAIDARGTAMYAVGTDGLVVRWTAATGWVVDHAAAVAPAIPAP